MWQRLKEFLRNLPGNEKFEDLRPDDELQVAAAALLFHIIDADGIRSDTERERLEDVLATEFGLAGDELKDLLKAGEEADREAVDLYSFTSVLKRHLGQDERLAFIRVLWEIVYADGDRNELEDNVVWRIAELLEVERADRVALRQSVEQGSKPE